MTMDATTEKVNLSKYIEMRDGRPNIRGRRLPVSFVASASHEQKLSNERIAYEYTLTEEEVLAALLYYREHKQEIDIQDEEEQRLFDEMYEQHGGMPGQRRDQK